MTDVDTGALLEAKEAHRKDGSARSRGKLAKIKNEVRYRRWVERGGPETTKEEDFPEFFARWKDEQ